MPGLVRGIHAYFQVARLTFRLKVVDGRDKPGHDEFQKLRRMLEPNGGLRVEALLIFSRAGRVPKIHS